MSVRRLAKLLNERQPSQSWASWKRALNRYLDEDADQPTVPSPETARLLAEILGEPAEVFVRPQARETLRDENLRLKERVAELEAELERVRQGRRSNG